MLKNDQWSYWERTQFMNEIDFIVIGAGIVGYSTALRLKKLHPNSRVVILERGNLPSGASSKNAGFACFGSASEIYDDIQEFGEEIVQPLKEVNVDFSLLDETTLYLLIAGDTNIILNEI